MTVKDAIAIMDAMYSKFDKADFTAKCEQFNIPLNQKIKEFSTGMKAKLKVLLAMSHGAKLLILDEPTSALDDGTALSLINSLKRGDVSI
jgi:ABC-2 type transport system ATP-binding protein